MLRCARVTAAVLTAAGLSCAPAAAVTPPVADPAVPPPDPTPGGAAMVQRTACAVTGVRPGFTPAVPSPSQAVLDLPAAWKFSRGEGQTVAIVDTGVRPGPRLPDVELVGDYIGGGDAVADCDGHGTLVAGIVAGQPGADAFSGVAPAARLLSIRQTSAHYDPQTTSDDPGRARAIREVDALARAIVLAADRGARVITVPAATCLPADEPVDQTTLGAAIGYAAVQRDAVIVAAAGDTGVPGAGPACAANPLTDPSRPDDPRNWAGVTSVSVPSWWQPHVLSVGSVTPGGQPSSFTMPGPWVGIAAPGEKIVSVGNDDGELVDGIPGYNGKLIPIQGTRYAAAHVAGVAALVRSRFPELSAAQVIDRISRTARNPARSPSNLVGAGVVDPLAALTWELPPAPEAMGPERMSLPPAPAPADMTPRIVAFGGAAVLAISVLATVLVLTRRGDDQETDDMA